VCCVCFCSNVKSTPSDRSNLDVCVYINFSAHPFLHTAHLHCGAMRRTAMMRSVISWRRSAIAWGGASRSCADCDRKYETKHITYLSSNNHHCELYTCCVSAFYYAIDLNTQAKNVPPKIRNTATVNGFGKLTCSYLIYYFEVWSMFVVVCQSDQKRSWIFVHVQATRQEHVY